MLNFFCLNSAKILKIDRDFPMLSQKCIATFLWFKMYCNSYNSYHRYTRIIKMLSFQNCFQYIQKISYLHSKKLPASGGFAPRSLTRGSAPEPRWRHSPRPPHLHPQYLLSPQTQGVWIKPCDGVRGTVGLISHFSD